MAASSIPHKMLTATALSATFLFTFSQFLLITAYPTIMTEFGVNATQVQWLTTAFLLATIIFIPMSGYFMNTFSAKSLVLFSMCTLLVGTAVGAAAPNFGVLVVSRAIQAIGAGIMLPLVQTILLSVFPYEKRGFAMGLLGAVINVAPASAPSLSGLVIDAVGWRALHGIMFVPAVVVFVLAVLFMKNVIEQQEARLDLLSTFLTVVGFAGFILGLSNVSTFGFVHGWTLIPLLSGGAGIVLLVRRQLQLEIPVLKVQLMRVPLFRLAMVLVFINMMLLLSAESILPMFAQDVLGTSAFLSGFLLVPGTILLSIMTIVAGRLYDKYGGRPPALAGFGLLFLSMVLFSTIGVDSSPYWIMLYFSVFMLGCGLTLMTLVTVSMNALPQKDITHGSAITNTFRQFGMAFGVITLTTVISLSTAREGVPYVEAAYEGTILVFWIMGACALGALLLSLRMNENPKPDSGEERTPE
ncbi:DHA2 family efflux MFS transporter permease subunit [Alkalicoccus chagannorensis]|uniref:DHA2 family efflux MFS transporter permease subunit n=1 Tax=Alkalicoccus chagannorensis TaxID=427072 RepID=UPI0004062A4B|nr:DHA2 family efflux MFS transporter permease subunit [Alkalicoccus chagannorensis]